ncbi:MAG: SCP2 sterol-binding domain-containing protein, partial [Alphaproteobacteria bacterium]|nr:SCP2 sterol-binding domain-containing protein [Alphaproteobacteria bacterium]
MSASFVLPAFSPALLLRPLLRPVPLPLFRRTANLLLRRMHRQHPGVAARLVSIAGTSFLISAAEMPYAVRLEVAPDGRLCIPSHDISPEADVRVYGTVDGLFGMLEGERDGDALFFSRELKVEGDTEALLTLRNALDSEALHLAELLVPAPLLP